MCQCTLLKHQFLLSDRHNPQAVLSISCIHPEASFICLLPVSDHFFFLWFPFKLFKFGGVVFTESHFGSFSHFKLDSGQQPLMATLKQSIFSFQPLIRSAGGELWLVKRPLSFWNVFVIFIISLIDLMLPGLGWSSTAAPRHDGAATMSRWTVFMGFNELFLFNFFNKRDSVWL